MIRHEVPVRWFLLCQKSVAARIRPLRRNVGKQAHTAIHAPDMRLDDYLILAR
jgi:hypothetical protein